MNSLLIYLSNYLFILLFIYLYNLEIAIEISFEKHIGNRTPYPLFAVHVLY